MRHDRHAQGSRTPAPVPAQQEAFAKEKERQRKEDELAAKSKTVNVFSAFDFDVWRTGPNPTIEDLRVIVNGPTGTVEQWAAYISEKHPNMPADEVTRTAQSFARATTTPDQLSARCTPQAPT